MVYVVCIYTLSLNLIQVTAYGLPQCESNHDRVLDVASVFISAHIVSMFMYVEEHRESYTGLTVVQVARKKRGWRRKSQSSIWTHCLIVSPIGIH